MDAASNLLRLLGDETRLRLLRVLAQTGDRPGGSNEQLNVSELTAILGVAQSGVSRHLGLLKEAGLVVEQRAGTFSWYRLDPQLESGSGAHAGLWSWLSSRFAEHTAATRKDDARLAEVRRVRREEFRQHGGDGQEHKQLVPGRSWAAWSRALGLLLPPYDVVDLGCGEGYLTIEAARWARRVIAIDRSADVLARAKDFARRRGVKNITWKRGDLEKVPVDSASADLVLLSQALHHADQPALALHEAYRVLKPGGRVLVLDLREHREEWVTSTLGDRWLGFDDASLERLIEEAGFRDTVVRAGSSRAGDPFAVLIASGTKPTLPGPKPRPTSEKR